MQRITDIAPATIDEQHRPNKAQADSPNIKCSFRLLKLKQVWRNKCKIHTKNTHRLSCGLVKRQNMWETTNIPLTYIDMERALRVTKPQTPPTTHIDIEFQTERNT